MTHTAIKLLLSVGLLMEATLAFQPAPSRSTPVAMGSYNNYYDGGWGDGWGQDWNNDYYGSGYNSYYGGNMYNDYSMNSWNPYSTDRVRRDMHWNNGYDRYATGRRVNRDGIIMQDRMYDGDLVEFSSGYMDGRYTNGQYPRQTPYSTMHRGRPQYEPRTGRSPGYDGIIMDDRRSDYYREW